MATQGFFAVGWNWSIVEWLGYSMLMLMFIYLIEIPFIFIADAEN